MKVLFDKIKRYYQQVCLILIRDGWKKAKWLKRNNIFYHIGDHCYYNPNILPAEPFLVALHNNIVIAAGVRLITHSVENTIFNYEEDTKEYYCRFGKIEIHDNVYIGANAIINFGVTIGANSIIAAGAVVTKDVEPGSIMAGVPARKIGNYNDLKDRAWQISREIGNNISDKSVRNLMKYKTIKFDIDKINMTSKGLRK